MSHPSRNIAETAAHYAATMMSDVKVTDLYEELQTIGPQRAAPKCVSAINAEISQLKDRLADMCGANDPDPYVYKDGSTRDEGRMCDQVNEPKSSKIMRKFLADVADKVCGERQDDYDVPERNHARTARIVTASLGCSFAADEVCIFNLAQKLSRCCHKLTYDSLLDFAGYCANLAAIMEIQE